MHSNEVVKVMHEEQLLALIIPKTYSEEGIHFFTPNDFSQQIAFMKHPTGKEIDPHCHCIVHREVHYTKEVLFIRKGKLRVDFYTNDKIYLESRILNEGDVILLSEAGHGFEVLEDLEMVEVKQGPFVGDQDKVRFKSIEKDKIIINL